MHAPAGSSKVSSSPVIAVVSLAGDPACVRAVRNTHHGTLATVLSPSSDDAAVSKGGDVVVDPLSVHTRSLVGEGGIVSMCVVVLHTVASWHVRSLDAVGAADSY